MARPTVTLDDKYERPSGRVYMTGSQALIRLAMNRAARYRVLHLGLPRLAHAQRG